MKDVRGKDRLSIFKHWLLDSKNTSIFVLAFLAFWELGVRIFKVPRYIVPYLTSIVGQFISHFDLIWEYTLVTGWETLVGFTIAVAIGIPLAMLVAFSRLLRQTFYPAAVALEMVPIS